MQESASRRPQHSILPTPGKAAGWLLAILLGAPLQAMAQMPTGITPVEMALLPVYCRDTNTFGYGGEGSKVSPRAGHWVGMMGRGFWGMHHYCWALINLSRAEKQTTNEGRRKYLREGAVADIDYAINHGLKDSGPDFLMLPELFWKRGAILVDLRRDAEAIKSFQASIEKKADYWPAYVGLADLYKRRGDRTKARETVELGLQQAPDAKQLQALLAELKDNRQAPAAGGKPVAEQKNAATTPSR